MRVLFYQPAHEGHYFAYLARMLPGFVDLPIDIILVTTERARASVEFAKSLAPFGDRLQTFTSCTPPPRLPLANMRHRLRELKEAITATRPDHVAVCFADGLWEAAYASTLVGRRPWPRDLAVEGWLYRGRFADPSDRRWKSRLRRIMFADLLRRGLFHRLHLHHELLHQFAAPKSVNMPTSVVLAPDPIVIHDPMTPCDARRQLGVASGGSERPKWIGVAGMIADFKGAHLLLDAYRIRSQRGDQPEANLLLAGPHQDKIRAMLREPPYRNAVAEGKIVSIDRFLSEDEMYWAAAGCDLVVPSYPQHQHRSSIILWAAAAGRPSLGSDYSCVGYVIRKERLGGVVNVRDTTALANSITAMLSAPWTPEDVARVRTYANFHRMENYQALSSQLVRERLGIANPAVTLGSVPKFPGEKLQLG